MTSASCFMLCLSDVAAFTPVTDEERQIWMGFPVQHKSNICIQSLNLCVAPPVTPAGRPPQCCHVVSAEITLFISLRRMSLAVLGGELSGMEGGRQGVV